MKSKRKKKNQADATLRNVRAANRKLAQCQRCIKSMFSIVRKQSIRVTALIDILKSKRLLTPSQVKMLEDALR